MTDKSIFVYKLLLSLNISDFSLFFYAKTGNPLKKSPLSSKNKNIPNKAVPQYSRQIQVTTVNDYKSLKFKNITNNKNQLK